MNLMPEQKQNIATTTIKELLDGNSCIEDLRMKVKVAPIEPGVYRWKNKDGEVLYVGKAKNLRNRLKSYVQPGEDANLGPWKRSMLRAIADLEVTITRSELEALVLETNLIKEIKPKYNVLMKDDKNYVYIRISTQFFPEVSVVRQMKKDQAAYFGPYVSSYETKRMLEVVHLVHPFMAEKETLKTLNSMHGKGEDTSQPIFTSPPLGVQIGKHCGLGTGEYSHEQYIDALANLKRFLRGERSSVMAALEQEMQTAAVSRQFEKAAKLRDALQYMKGLEEKQLVSDTSGENTDYIGLAMLRGYSQVVLMKEREGKLIAEQSFSFKGQSEDELEVLQSFMTQYYSENQDIPTVIVLPFGFTENAVLQEWLTGLRGAKVELRVPERGKKVALLDLAVQNAEQKVKQQEARWEAEKAETEAALAELQDLLQLPSIPKRIEGYDISHMGGTETVGSMVVTKNGKAANDQYRSFTIKSLKSGQIDDYASLKEVLERRLAYLVDSVNLQLEREKANGYEFGRTKKAEVPMVYEQWCTIDPKITLEDFARTIDYKEVFVARKDGSITQSLWLQAHDGLVELQGVQLNSKPTSITKLLIVLALKTIKKGKVYIRTKPELQNFWIELGCTVLRTRPKAIVTRFDDEIFMVYQVKKAAKDSSLTSRPDLLVIDGGKGQLSTVVEVLKELELTIPVIGLAKREEEVFVPGAKVSIEMKKGCKAQLLLMRLRNEAHRFANKLREKKGLKNMTQSWLDEIDGIGPITKDKLLKKFGTVEAIERASDSALLEIVSEGQLEQLRSRPSFAD